VNEQNFLSISDIAQMLSVTTRSVFEYRKSGIIPAPDIRLPGGPRWRVETIEAALEKMHGQAHTA